MGNTSKKRRNKRLWTGGIIALIALLVIAFFVSKTDDAIDPAAFASLEVSEEEVAHTKGNTESGLLLVEYSDFQCPACKAAAPAVADLVENFGDQFALEYRHFPLSQIHPNAKAAAAAAEAAGIQGKFWEMHDMLFDNQSQWGQSFNPERFFRGYAVELGLNEDRFRFDLDSAMVNDRVEADAAEAAELQLPGTPAFVFNGEQVDVNEFIANNIDTSAFEVDVEGDVEPDTTTSQEA